MFEFITGIFALGVVAQVLFWVVAGVLFPVFWLWMLVDAALRDDNGYASGKNEKLIWIVLMVFVQFAAVIYFPLVYLRMGRSVGGAKAVAA